MKRDLSPLIRRNKCEFKALDASSAKFRGTDSPQNSPIAMAVAVLGSLGSVVRGLEQRTQHPFAVLTGRRRLWRSLKGDPTFQCFEQKSLVNAKAF